MKSKDSLTQEIEIDLQKYWLVLKRRWPVVVLTCALTTGLAALMANSQQAVFRARAKLLIESNQASSLIGLEGASRELTALTSQEDPIDTQIEVFKSIPIAQAVIDELQMEDEAGEPLESSAFLNYLDVKAIPGTDVLEIGYRAADPELATAVVNTIMGVYIQNDIMVSRAAASSAREFIKAQLPESEREVDIAESALRRFKEANQIVDLTEEASNTVQVLSGLDDSIIQIQADLADTTARANEIQQRLRLSPASIYAVGLVSESPGVQEVLEKLQVVQSQLAAERARYEEGHPAIATLRRQESSLTALVQQRVGSALGSNSAALPADDLQAGELELSLISEFLALEATRSGLAQRLASLANAQQAQGTRAQALPSLEKRQGELERNRSAAQTTYETLLQNLQQTQVIENQNVGNARIVSPALIPNDPMPVPGKLYIAAGLIAGGLLGLALAFLLDLVDRSIKTVREGQELYGYPLVGVIPAWKKLPGRSKEIELPSVLVREPQPLPIIESYQALQANLKFSYLDKPLKTITVTSSVAGEGKSEVAANLALTLAQLGHLVLVIDADMRNPVQHHIWQVSNLQGLSNAVAGQVPLKEAIVRQEPNLHVLPVGVIPPNPLAILESQRMSALLRECETIYDYIIVDTPAVSGRADTLTVGRSTDGVLVVMQAGLTDINSINATKVILSQSQQRVLGLVANGVKVSSQPDHYFYYNQEYVIRQNQESSLSLSSQLNHAGQTREKV